MVGRLVLVQLIGVRVPVPQLIFTTVYARQRILNSKNHFERSEKRLGLESFFEKFQFN